MQQLQWSCCSPCEVDNSKWIEMNQNGTLINFNQFIDTMSIWIAFPKPTLPQQKPRLSHIKSPSGGSVKRLASQTLAKIHGIVSPKVIKPSCISITKPSDVSLDIYSLKLTFVERLWRLQKLFESMGINMHKRCKRFLKRHRQQVALSQMPALSEKSGMYNYEPYAHNSLKLTKNCSVKSFKGRDEKWNMLERQGTRCRAGCCQLQDLTLRCATWAPQGPAAAAADLQNWDKRMVMCRVGIRFKQM